MGILKRTRLFSDSDATECTAPTADARVFVELRDPYVQLVIRVLGKTIDLSGGKFRSYEPASTLAADINYLLERFGLVALESRWDAILQDTGSAYWTDGTYHATKAAMHVRQLVKDMTAGTGLAKNGVVSRR